MGPALADALAARSELVQRVDSWGLWLIWFGGLVSTLVASSVSLTANRVLGPAAMIASLAAVATGARGPAAIVAVLFGLLTLVAVVNREIADCYLNGSSYGDERRFLLRTPAPLLLGPLELAVTITIAGAVTGPMLLAADATAAGAIAIVVGWPLVYLTAKPLHGLSRRWLVFVPAGLVVHDYTALVDSMLIPRKDVASIGWAPDETDALDLTANGLGRRLQILLREPASVLLRPARRPHGDGPAVEPRAVSAVLVAPARGAAVLAEATVRHLAVAS